MTTFLILSVGFLLGHRLPYWVADIVNYFIRRKILRDVTPAKIDEKRLCKGPHVWMSAPLWNDKGETTVKICQVCGFLPEMDKMVTLEAIDRIEENNKIREIEKRIYKDFITKEDDDIKKYFDAEIKNGVEFEKLAHVHGAGMTFGARYNIYKTARAGEIQEALKKSDA